MEEEYKLYTYEVLDSRFKKFKTYDWQKAIDYWSEIKAKENYSCTITVINEDKEVSWMRDGQEIHAWSEKLKEEERVSKIMTAKNRVEKRIAKEFSEYGNYGENNSPLPDFHGNFKEMSEEAQDNIINPKHYKMIPSEAYSKHPEGLEYMDLMGYILKHHDGVEAHLLGQVFKYSCRLGKKDDDLQDAKKIEWYANRLVSTIKERS
jgi:hypothetical protein